MLFQAPVSYEKQPASAERARKMSSDDIYIRVYMVAQPCECQVNEMDMLKTVKPYVETFFVHKVTVQHRSH